MKNYGTTLIRGKKRLGVDERFFIVNPHFKRLLKVTGHFLRTWTVKVGI